MATEIRVPTLGESVAEATISRWMKSVGDSIAADYLISPTIRAFEIVASDNGDTAVVELSVRIV
uniref:biotin/lipoyl-containing protein n=1 Tax=uncultured Nitratireductor sp. TaxID=520953 RepID=UPI0025D3AD81